ncbi:MAG TPA: phosphate signaling complex protein PhoU [Pseudonocardia sp.]|nr:phosphate signaling complex protein PhoU [Pseudonocardia sp.]
MREIFHGELERLGTDLASMCGLVRSTMERATRALVETDLHLAEQIISDGAEIRRRGQDCADQAAAMLALQAPVARDLRTVVTGIQAAEKIERMGDLARHVAEIVRLRHPEPAVPPELLGRFAEMGRLAAASSKAVEDAIAAPDGEQSSALERADDDTDRLQRELLDEVSQHEPPYPVRVGVDVALLARYFERYADQAVSIIRRLDYVVTGAMPDRGAAPDRADEVGR